MQKVMLTVFKGTSDNSGGAVPLAVCSGSRVWYRWEGYGGDSTQPVLGQSVSLYKVISQLYLVNSRKYNFKSVLPRKDEVSQWSGCVVD